MRQNVAMASGVGKTPEERYEHALEYVRLVGLEDCADLSPVELSTGMKQRLGLARVLASQAELLLMDEPFASLDFITRAELQNQVLQLQKNMPRTIVLVTHQLDEALLLGQSVTVMHELGRNRNIRSVLYSVSARFIKSRASSSARGCHRGLPPVKEVCHQDFLQGARKKVFAKPCALC